LKYTRKIILNVLDLLLLISFFSIPVYAESLTINPQTQFAEQFIRDCEKEEWFLEEINNLLSVKGKSINTVASEDDFRLVTSIGLKDKDIEGKIPKAIGYFKDLRFLYLANNKLTGEIPNELYSLTKLENLDLSDNELEGEISDAIGNLTNLETLLLWDNKLTGNIPNSIGNLTKIVNLDLSFNGLSGIIPEEIFAAKNLKILSLSNNKLEGEISESINELFLLKELLLWNNSFKGEIPEGINSIENFEKIDLSQNNFTGPISKMIIGNKSLKLIDLSDNLFVGDLDDDFISNLDDTVLHIENNYLYGPNIENLNNIHNLNDEFDEQYRLKINEHLTTRTGNELNILPLIQVVNVDDGTVIKEEIDLPYKYFEFVELDASLKRKINIYRGSDDSIRIKALAPISKSENAIITIYIGENAGSDYSTVSFLLTATNPPSSGSGSSISIFPVESEVVEPVKKIEEEKVVEPKPTKTLNISFYKKYMSGYEDGSFKPDGEITREEMAYILYTLNKNDTNDKDIPANSYTDVDEGRWSCEAINFITDCRLMVGYPDNTFKPRNRLTRAELATIISRYMALEIGNKTSFADATEHWSTEYIHAVNDKGYMKGYPDGSFKPDNNITRAETVATMNRILGRTPDEKIY